MIFVAVVTSLTETALIFDNYFEYSKFSNDFSVYWRAANQPLEQVYFWKGRFPFPYAPTMLLWISPLSVIPKWPAYFLFGGISVTAFVLACRPYLPKAAIALAMISPPFVRGIFTGQVCALLGALLIWACGTRNRLAAGIALGIIATIKPQLVLMAPLMLALNKDWRAWWSALGAFLFIVLLSLVIFGPARWPEWAGSMDHFRSALIETRAIRIGVSPAAVAERFGYPPLPFLFLGTLGGALIVYLCRFAEALEKAAAIALGSILAAPYALAYDLTPIMPLLALAVFRGRILAAFGMGYPTPPIPVIISVYELLSSSGTRRSAPQSQHPLHSAPPA